ncbi:2-polyprenyl-6-methoxyphenol hydroxylase-like FAD-dependent oxidoreductase [Saccharopolyspora phatthalungensis]|uniref:2-polyprenyl-6-methoxyphenol hydroxylase-like FAD-dependent oxidoreductase n=2 Tax=Saccharopolyspora phatthalungensis TaxID=664693 RepID=A0A840QGM1_9PSEU|nr:2-polyprenyl-6-methoxyphenol hydroxylase-like FAD-dependent oxidoreductase [Saccharopolyspora phatthalungensis]
MTVAGDLARMGHSVTVLERWPQINPSSRAFATMARTLEVLDSRGLAEDLLAKGNATPAVSLFKGAKMDLTRLPSRYQCVLVTPQTNVDQALGEYAVAQGAQVLRGVEVVGLDQDADGVTVTARPKGGGAPTSWRASYVVGADGAHSTVRDLIGKEFPGKSVLHSMVLADVRLTNGPAGGGLTLGSTPEVIGFLVSYGHGGWYRSMTWDRHRQLPDDAPVTENEIRDVLNRAMKHDVGLAEISWKSRFHADERQVANYRDGRVFLAGDAAHVHSPMGGQGMNTGIQDAANLAWKLALALDGADDAILDTYQAERHPIGRRVVMQSGVMMRMVTSESAALRWLRDQFFPRLMRARPLSNAIAGSFSGVGLRYKSGRHQDKLVGTRATEVPLVEGRLTELQRHPGFVLIREKGTPRLDTDLIQAERTDGGPALLVRPDGYVAWAGATDAREHGWRDALAGWTGGEVGTATTAS